MGRKCGYVKYFLLKNVNVVNKKEWRVVQTVSAE